MNKIISNPFNALNGVVINFVENCVATIKNKKIKVNSVNNKIKPKVSKEINQIIIKQLIKIKKNQFNFVNKVWDLKNIFKFTKSNNVQNKYVQEMW